MSAVILQARPAEPSREHEAVKYHDLNTRVALVEPIGDYITTLGRLTDDMVRDVALRSGRSLKRARQMCEEWLEVQAVGLPERKVRLSDAFLVVVAEKNGNAAAAIRAYFPTEAEQKRVRSSVYRWMDEAHIDILLALKGGREKWERFIEVGIYEPDHRNELWLIDEMHIPIRCRGSRGHVIENLYLISVFDTFGRLCLNAQVTLGPSDAVMASAVIARAVAGGAWDGIDYGGSADALGLDNALIFKSDAVRDVLRVAGIPPRFARPYTPPDKAKEERWHGTVQKKWLTSFPAYLDGPKRRVFLETGELDKDGKPKRERMEIPLHVPVDPDLLPSLEDVTQGMYAVIHDYNLNHVHSVTNSTAIRKYGSDPRPLARPGIAAFWDIALPTGKEVYVGERRGIHVDGEWRRAAGVSLTGRELTARLLPGLDPRYLVGTKNGRFLTEVTPTSDESSDEAETRLARNHAFVQRLTEITTIARTNVTARVAGNPGTPAYVSEKRADELQASAQPPLASVAAALAVPERPQNVA